MPRKHTYQVKEVSELAGVSVRTLHERFAGNIDKYGKGLTPFLAAAIRENAKSHGS